MARQSLRPTAAGFGAVVAATGRKGLWRMALLLMEKMEDLGIYRDIPSEIHQNWGIYSESIGNYRGLTLYISILTLR